MAAATRAFAKKGYARTTISDIAAEAGLSHGLVYHYFASKAAVFGAIADDMMARVDRDMDCGEEERALDRIERSLERHRARLEQQQVDAHRVIMQAMLQGSVPEDVRARLQAHFAGVFARVRGWIEEAQRDGDVLADLPAEDVAATLVCIVRGMSIRSPNMPELPFAPPRTHTILRLLAPGAAAVPLRSKSAAAPAAARRKVRDHARPKKKR